MCAAGRVPIVHSPRAPNANFFRVVYFCACFTLTVSSEYGVPIEIKLWDTGRTPLAHMVDVTNEFGLKVLAEHNFLNDNNIAFSPYGLMGIMVALYEGVDGESSYQIQRGMQLPWNRNIMRIGFRDIHRTLKTYFVPEEGFLAGLALNNENVTFNDQYKTVLRFYGFDLENDQLPTLSPETNTTTSNETNTMTSISPPSSGASTTMTVPVTTEKSQSTPPSREETTSTTNPNAETIDIRGDTSTTASPSSAPNAESTPMSTSIVSTEQATSERIAETTTQAGTTSTQAITTTSQTVTPITEAATTTTQTPSSRETEPTTTTVAQSMSTDVLADSTDTQTSLASQAMTAMTNEPTTNNEVDTSTIDISTAQTTLQTTTVDTTSSTAQSTATDTTTTISTLESSTIVSTMTTDNSITSPITMTSTLESQQTEQITTSADDSSTTSMISSTNAPSLETLERRKKSIVDFIFTNPPYMDDYTYYRSFDIGGESNLNDKMFLANGLKSVQVTYMQYDTVLEHAYLPHLEASALRLPLDSDRYYLLVVLPTRGGVPELGRLLSRMARESDLSDIYSVLRPRRVKGIVPSFTVKGHVTLTTDLQKLGIRDVFEPRQHDFTPMTRQPGVYVRSIEQAVSVAIRKYRPDDHKKNRYVTSREPLVFSATYPFLYFVMDANIHVALMAGKMVDPLNSRIL